MAEQGNGYRKYRAGDREGERGPLATIAKVGAVATALGAVVALVVGVKSLLPGPTPSPRGEISELELAGVAGLSDVASRVPDDTKCPGIEHRPRYRVKLPVRTASLTLDGVLALYEEPPPPEPEPPSEPYSPPEDPTTDEQYEYGEDGEAGEVSPEDDPAGSSMGSNYRADPSTVDDVVDRTDLPERRVANLMSSPEPGEDVDKEQVAAIIERTRADEADEPIGWLLDVSTLLEHLDGRCAYLQWSLYDAKRLRRVRLPWLIDRRGARFIPEGTPDERSAAFWVPMPIARRKYMLRVALYDSEAKRLDIARVKGLR